VKRSLAPVGQQLEQEEQSRLELSEPKPKNIKKIQKYYIYTKQNTSALDTQPTVAAKLKRLLIITLVMPIQG